MIQQGFMDNVAQLLLFKAIRKLFPNYNLQLTYSKLKLSDMLWKNIHLAEEIQTILTCMDLGDVA